MDGTLYFTYLDLNFSGHKKVKWDFYVNLLCLIGQLQKGVITIPKSVTKSRIIDNFNVLDFTLTEDDIKQVESLDKGADGRINGELMLKDSKDYPFNDEF